VSTIEELLGSGLESRECGRRDQSPWPRGILCPQKLAQTSPTSGGRSVGIVRWRTQATELVTQKIKLFIIRYPLRESQIRVNLNSWCNSSECVE
jgi:hypothetical protein